MGLPRDREHYLWNRLSHESRCDQAFTSDSVVGWWLVH